MSSGTRGANRTKKSWWGDVPPGTRTTGCLIFSAEMLAMAMHRHASVRCIDVLTIATNRRSVSPEFIHWFTRLKTALSRQSTGVIPHDSPFLFWYSTIDHECGDFDTYLCSDSGSVGVGAGISGFVGSITQKVLVDFGLPVRIPLGYQSEFFGEIRDSQSRGVAGPLG